MRHFAFAVLLIGLLFIIGCSSSSSSSHEEESATSPNCTEPANPYDEGTGHYAGYEWAEKNNPTVCGGSSQSFIEGCEEYERRESEYQECEARKRH